MKNELIRFANKLSVMFTRAVRTPLLIIHCSLFVTFSAFAELSYEDHYIPMDNAVVQVMDKAAGRTRTLTIPVGTSTRFDRLDIQVRKCYGVNEFLPEDFYMLLDVRRNDNRIFSGWMVRSEPGQNPLQDPDNDLWLVRCE